MNRLRLELWVFWMAKWYFNIEVSWYAFKFWRRFLLHIFESHVSDGNRATNFDLFSSIHVFNKESRSPNCNRLSYDGHLLIKLRWFELKECWWSKRIINQLINLKKKTHQNWNHTITWKKNPTETVLSLNTCSLISWRNYVCYKISQ